MFGEGRGIAAWHVATALRPLKALIEFEFSARLRIETRTCGHELEILPYFVSASWRDEV